MRPSFDTNKQKTNRHVNPAETHVHTNRHRHARRVHFPTLMHTQRHTHRHTPFWRRHDDFLPPVSSLSHTHTHSLSLFLSLGLVEKCSAASVPLNRQAQPLPTIGDDAAVLTLPALSVFGHASTPLFSFFFLLFLFFSSFFFWCAKKQQEHALSHVHTLVSHSTPTHPPSFVPVQTQRRDGIA